MAVREPAGNTPTRTAGSTAKLIFVCGKMAAGKSTLARELTEREGAILLIQDQLLGSLYPGEIIDIPGFTLRSSRLQAAHELHFVDAPDALCKTQLRERSRDLPPDSRWTTDAEFEAITAYFQPPSADEGFNVVRHERA